MNWILPYLLWLQAGFIAIIVVCLCMALVYLRRVRQALDFLSEMSQPQIAIATDPYLEAKPLVDRDNPLDNGTGNRWTDATIIMYQGTEYRSGRDIVLSYPISRDSIRASVRTAIGTAWPPNVDNYAVFWPDADGKKNNRFVEVQAGALLP